MISTTALFLRPITSWAPLVFPNISRRSFGELSRPAGKDLSFSRFDPSHGEKECPLVIVHGLYGNKENWRSIGKRLALETKRAVFTVDLRNHGTSPHSDLMTYAGMVADLRKFITTQSLSKFALLGHSMGAKAVMAYALDDDTCVDRLIIEDMAPVYYEDFSEILPVVDCLVSMPVKKMSSKREAENYMMQHIPGIDMTTVRFLSTNLVREDEGFSWRCEVDTIHRSIHEIRGFPNFTEPYVGKTLVVYGTKSPYVKSRYFPAIKRLFPNTTFASLNTNHWIHVEEPNKFIHVVRKFLELK